MAGAGPRGYPDWQRVNNWDGPVLSEALVGTENTFNSGVIAVGDYGYLIGQLDCASSLGEYTLEWFQSATGTKLPAEATMQRKITVGGPVGERIGWPMMLRVPHLGPFVRIRAQTAPGKEGEPKHLLYSTNRISSSEVIPRQPFLMINNHTFVGAGSFTWYPNFYWSGPARLLSYVSEKVTVSYRVESAANNEAYELADFAERTVGVQEGTVIIPPGAWRVKAEAAAATVSSIVVTPSITGAT